MSALIFIILLMVVIFLAIYSEGLSILIWHFVTSLFAVIILTVGQSATVRNLAMQENLSVESNKSYQEGIVAAWHAMRELYPDVIIAILLPFVGLLIVHITRRVRNVHRRNRGVQH